jgi:hypothetical protein
MHVDVDDLFFITEPVQHSPEAVIPA